MTRRRDIRARVVDILKNYGSEAPVNGHPTSAGTRVYPNRKRKLASTQLPCILVFTNSEASEIFDQAPRSYKKTLSLGVAVIAQDNDALNDTLDVICEQIEKIFCEDMFLGTDEDELVEECTLKNTEMGISVDCDVQTGGALMSFDVVYIEDAVNSGNVEPHKLVPFKTIYLDSRPNGGTSATKTEKDQLELAWQEE